MNNIMVFLGSPSGLMPKLLGLMTQNKRFRTPVVRLPSFWMNTLGERKRTLLRDI